MKSNWIQKWCFSESSLGTLTPKSLNQQIVSVGTLTSFYNIKNTEKIGKGPGIAEYSHKERRELQYC